MRRTIAAGWVAVFTLLGVLPSSAQNTPYVNLFIGTSGDNGQVSPGATVPFGMVCICPDSDPRTHAGYDYAVPRISGISINRLSGVGCSGGGGNLRIRPEEPSVELSIRKDTEKAVPGYYESCFSNGVKGEFTATRAMAVERYHFPAQRVASLHIDFSSSFEDVAECSFKAVSETCIEGYIKAKNVCGHGRYKLYFSMVTDQPFHVDGETPSTAMLRFDEKARGVEVRIALSPLSNDEARNEYLRWKNTSLEKIKKLAASQWKEKLDAIMVKGGTQDDKVLFYTSLYRTMLSPVDVTSADGNYLGTDGKTYKADRFRYYSSWSLWDTFRTKFPMLVLLQPKEMHDMATSLIRLYATGKKDWSTPNESTPTVRTEHAVVLLLDAYRKGLTSLDFRPGYAGMKEEMTRLPMRSPDQRMESAYDLWAMAQIAGIIGEKVDSADYDRQASVLFEETWKNEFMTITPAFGVMRNNGLYQGTRWQYRWAAPQYVDRMIAWVGQDSLCTQLDYFFDHHLYNQGNEPDIHVPYLYNRLGAPAKAQQLVRNLLSEPMIHKYGGNAEFATPYYGKAFKNHPEGYSPEMDEDDGTMSAWYMFGAMGIYPLTVGEEWYELISPLFDRISLNVANGRKLVIRTEGRTGRTDAIKNISFNKKTVTGYRISHNELVKGGELIFYY